MSPILDRTMSTGSIRLVSANKRTLGSWTLGDQRSQLRPDGSGPTEAVPGGEGSDDVLNAMRGTSPSKTQPAAKLYNCENGAPIAITGSGTYGGGTYGFDPATSTLTFHGGTYDGQRAVYELSYGLAKLHIIGPSGRLVIDCD